MSASKSIITLLCAQVLLAFSAQAQDLPFHKQLASDVAAMDNVVATQSVVSWGNGHPETRSTSELAVYGGQQIASEAPIYVGVQPFAAWHGMLWRLQLQRLELSPAGYSYPRALCPWRETVRGPLSAHVRGALVPCSGSLTVDSDNHVLALSETLALSSAYIRAITTTVKYGPVKLRDRDLWLPLSGQIVASYAHGQIYSSSVTWTDYHEYRASEPVVTDVEPDFPMGPVKQGILRIQSSEISGKLETPAKAMTSVDSAMGPEPPPSLPSAASILTPSLPVESKNEKAHRGRLSWWPRIKF